MLSEVRDTASGPHVELGDCLGSKMSSVAALLTYFHGCQLVILGAAESALHGIPSSVLDVQYSVARHEALIWLYRTSR